MRVQYGEECTKEESSWSICIKYEILPFTDKVAVEKQQTLLCFLRILALLVESVHQQSDRFVRQNCDYFTGPLCVKMEGQADSQAPSR